MRAGRGIFAKAVGAFVPKVTAAVVQKFGFHSAEILSSWDVIAGADIARLARPESIKWPRGGKTAIEDTDEGGRGSGATLVIAVEPAFALEVSYRHKELIDRINRYFGYRAIAQIKVHQVPQFEDSKPSNGSAPGVALPGPAAIGSGDLASALDALGRNVAASHRR
ncbi:MAG: DciA family protein [Hyphomicrobium sp.]|uniref:DUF721 domain-containing protein n=1 Tax=Hyphomicrobium sp. TaxID=82 RepID=UPI0039E2EDE7